MMSDPTQNPATQSPVLGDITIVNRTAWNGWFPQNITLDDETILQRGGNSQGLKLYDELQRDAKVAEQLQKRQLALLSREWVVEPASHSRADKKAADLVRAQLTYLGYDRVCGYLFDALMKGVAFVEPIWQRDGTEIACVDAVHCEPWMFVFATDPAPDDLIVNRFAVRMASPSKPDGEPIPPAKMMVHQWGSRYSNPWGLGLGNKLFWPVYFKRQGIQFWLSFAERFGTPVPWGQYPQNATPEQKATLRQALRAFTQESSLMTPVGMEVQLIEAARSGIDTYERLVVYMDSQIAGIILGKSGGKDSGGQLATAVAVENEVRLELVKGDADLMDAVVNRQLVRWIVDYNIPGAGYPTVKRVISEPLDTKALAETYKTIADMGFRPSLQQITDAFGIGWTETVPANNDAQAAKQPAFAAHTATNLPPLDLPGPQPKIDGLIAVDTLVKTLDAPALDAQAAGLLEAPIGAVMTADNFDEALTALEVAREQQEVSALAEALYRAAFTSTLLGRADA